MRSNSLSKDSVLVEEALLPMGRGRGSDRGRGRGSVVGTSTPVPAVQCGEANGDRNKNSFKVSSELFLLVNLLLEK